MVTKIILLLILLFAAYGIAVLLLKRLSDNAKQIAALRSELARNDEKLSARVAALQEEKTRREADAAREPDVKERPNTWPTDSGD